MSGFVVDGESNDISVADGVALSGWVKGVGNIIKIEAPKHACQLDLRISGDNNYVLIKSPFAIKGLQVRIGNHVRANKVILEIAEGFSIEGAGQFLLYNSGNKLSIGSQCMFSNNVTVRCGDSPHLLFDRESGDYLDVSDGVFIGDHVWVGERAYITKKTTIPSECLVAACSVVTRRFDKTHCVLAGNPASVVRENIQWIRNHSHLEKDSLYKAAYDRRREMYERGVIPDLNSVHE